MKLGLFLLSIAASAQPLLINAGGPSVDAYQADQYFTGGSVWAPGTPGYNPAIGTGVWATLRYAPTFSYDIPLPNGIYRVVFDLIEPNKTAAGQRKFAITANGQATPVLDLFALTGGDNIPYATELLVLVGNGHLKINFVATLGNAVVSGIEIRPPTVTGIQPTEHAIAFLVQLSDGQIRGATVTTPMVVADKEVCLGSLASGSQCDGLVFFRLVNPDGSDGGSFVASAAPPGMVLSPTHWTPVPVN
jgi:hypothetical protein